jgi:hypothetical protein
MLHSSFCNENAAKCLKDRYFEMASCPHGSQSAQAKLTASAQLKPSENPPWYAFGLQTSVQNNCNNRYASAVQVEATGPQYWRLDYLPGDDVLALSLHKLVAGDTSLLEDPGT